eukprot:365116-Chlamydomonas_euryale.AAC.4
MGTRVCNPHSASTSVPRAHDIRWKKARLLQQRSTLTGFAVRPEDGSGRPQLTRWSSPSGTSWKARQLIIRQQHSVYYSLSRLQDFLCLSYVVPEGLISHCSMRLEYLYLHTSRNRNYKIKTMMRISKKACTTVRVRFNLTDGWRFTPCTVCGFMAL